MDYGREKALEILCMGLRVSAKMRHRETERGRCCRWRGRRTSIQSFPNTLDSQISQWCEWLHLSWFGAWLPVTVHARGHGSFSVTSEWKLVLLDTRHVLSHSHTFVWVLWFFWFFLDLEYLSCLPLLMTSFSSKCQFKGYLFSGASPASPSKQHPLLWPLATLANLRESRDSVVGSKLVSVFPTLDWGQR